MIRRCLHHGTSPEGPASLLDNEDMLWEILLRLPPQPSSLPRASVVCKRWRRLVTDPNFLRRFRAHHCKEGPPLLGAFMSTCADRYIKFAPILQSVDCIPPERFDLGRYSDRGRYISSPANIVLDCRHGRVLIKNFLREEVAACDPITGEQCILPIPPGLQRGYLNGVVLCIAAPSDDHVHGSCHSSPLKVVLMNMSKWHTIVLGPIACVYSSEIGIWGNLLSTSTPCASFDPHTPGSLIGNSLYWVSIMEDILEIDLDRQRLTVIEGPPRLTEVNGHRQHKIIKAEDNNIGVAVLYNTTSFQMWRLKVSSQGVTTWLLWKTLDIYNILGISPQIERFTGRMLGYDEDTDVIFIYVHDGVYMVQLKSMQCRKLYDTDYYTDYHPFKSFWAPGTSITGGRGGTEMLHDT